MPGDGETAVVSDISASVQGTVATTGGAPFPPPSSPLSAPSSPPLPLPGDPGLDDALALGEAVPPEACGPGEHAADVERAGPPVKVGRVLGADTSGPLHVIAIRRTTSANTSATAARRRQ